MNNIWYQALMATPPRVYGRNLKPFSLIHRMTLIEFNSPFIFGGPIRLEDVYRCVSICSRSRNELRNDLFWLMTPFAFLTWSIRWFRVRKRTPEIIETIRQYIEDFTKSPKHSMPEKLGEGWVRLKSPFDFVLHKTLCARGYPPEDAWDVSCALARCLYDVDQEIDCRDKTLLSQVQLEEDEVHAKALEAERAGNKTEADRLYAQEEKMISARMERD